MLNYWLFTELPKIKVQKQQVDNIIWTEGIQKYYAAKNLSTRKYKPKPLKRIYILKKNAKYMTKKK
jgi:hypothetical protein